MTLNPLEFLIFSRQFVKESIHFTFDEDSFIQYRTDYPTNILNELVLSPYDSFSEPIVQTLFLVEIISTKLRTQLMLKFILIILKIQTLMQFQIMRDLSSMMNQSATMMQYIGSSVIILKLRSSETSTQEFLLEAGLPIFFSCL